MKQLFFLTSILIFFAFALKAQVNALPFMQALGVYQPITGMVVGTAMDDDNFYANLPLGFSVTFNGHVTSKFGICSNGFIVMDSLVHLSPWTPNNSASNTIAVLWADLKNSNAGGSMEYITTGAAPNRVCIIQWKNYNKLSGASNLNAQIRIYESSNCIQLCYGNNVSTGVIHVGLIGDMSTDFALRATTTGWLNSVASSSFPGIGMMQSSTSTLPTGLVFSFGTCPPVTPLEVDEFLANKEPFTVYPNPTSNGITISSASMFANAQIMISDIQGKIVLAKEIKQSNSMYIDLIDLQKGTYLLEITEGKKTTHKKLIKH